jgi:hypothetical protein
MLIISCGGDDDDNSKTTTTETNKTYNVYASALLDKKLAEYGYMEVSYTYNGKTQSFQVRKGDNSDLLPESNSFASQVFGSVSGTTYNNEDFIIHNIVLKNVSVNENVSFKSKFIADPNHPALTEDENRYFVKPIVVGYTDGALTSILKTLLRAKVRVDNFDHFPEGLATELPAIFGPNKSQE